MIIIDLTPSLRTKACVYQYSEIFCFLMYVFFGGGSYIEEDMSVHLMSYLFRHPKFKICNADTILRAMKEQIA